MKQREALCPGYFSSDSAEVEGTVVSHDLNGCAAADAA
jgi:hypothetical protein